MRVFKMTTYLRLDSYEKSIDRETVILSGSDMLPLDVISITRKMKNIPTYAIEYMSIVEGIVNEPDDLASELGKLILKGIPEDKEGSIALQLSFEDTGETKTPIITTDNIVSEDEVTLDYVEIFSVNPGTKFKANLIAMKGTFMLEDGRQNHDKFKPLTNISYRKYGDYYLIRYHNLGQLSNKYIIQYMKEKLGVTLREASKDEAAKWNVNN